MIQRANQEEENVESVLRRENEREQRGEQYIETGRISKRHWKAAGY